MVGLGGEARPNSASKQLSPTEQLLSDKTVSRFIADVNSLIE